MSKTETMAQTKSGRYVWIPDVNLREDMAYPRTYPAEYCDNTGRRTGRRVSVQIDHEATGTGTTGTGDTVVRVVRGRPRIAAPRNLRLEIRLTPADEAALTTCANAAGLSVSEYVRRRALSD